MPGITEAVVLSFVFICFMSAMGIGIWLVLKPLLRLNERILERNLDYQRKLALARQGKEWR